MNLNNLADAIETVRRPHDFDGPDAPYNPEVLAVARAAERLTDEVERLQARINAALELCAVVSDVNGVPHVAAKFRAVLTAKDGDL